MINEFKTGATTLNTIRNKPWEPICRFIERTAISIGYENRHYIQVPGLSVGYDRLTLKLSDKLIFQHCYIIIEPIIKKIWSFLKKVSVDKSDNIC